MSASVALTMGMRWKFLRFRRCASPETMMSALAPTAQARIIVVRICDHGGRDGGDRDYLDDCEIVGEKLRNRNVQRRDAPRESRIVERSFELTDKRVSSKH